MNRKDGVLVVHHLLAGLLACLLLSHCTEKNPLQPASSNPQIVLIQTPERVYQFPVNPAGVHVRAEDPQGINTLAGVQLTVRPANQNIRHGFDMRDDGLNGDILAGDGQYFIAIDTALVHNQTGTFILEAVARDRDNYESETKRDTVTILPGRENRPPQILSATAPERIWPDSTYRPQLLARASDPDGDGTVRVVRVEIYPPFFSRPAFTDSLLDDGQHGDGAAGDGVFGQTLTPARFGCKVGLYSFVFRAVDTANGVSAAEIKTIPVNLLKENNLPPRLAGLQAPSTISRNVTPNTYVLSVQVSDPNAPCDKISRVFFNTFLPNGNPSSGNPFLMRDDGQQGDAAAGDGRYSLTIQISSQNATGNYRFEFQAQDQKGALSDKLIHTIIVTE